MRGKAPSKLLELCAIICKKIAEIRERIVEGKSYQPGDVGKGLFFIVELGRYPLNLLKSRVHTIVLRRIDNETWRNEKVL
jgi:hypothetical protein